MLKFKIYRITSKVKHLYAHARRGFTLLETLLAVALLLILVLIVSQGLISTMQYSANTAQYQKSGNRADSQANAILSNSGSLSANTAEITLTDISNGNIVNSLSIGVFSLQPTPSTGYAGSEYQEISSLDSSDNRHVFTYIYVSPTP